MLGVVPMTWYGVCRPEFLRDETLRTDTPAPVMGGLAPQPEPASKRDLTPSRSDAILEHMKRFAGLNWWPS